MPYVTKFALLTPATMPYVKRFALLTAAAMLWWARMLDMRIFPGESTYYDMVQDFGPGDYKNQIVTCVD